MTARLHYWLLRHPRCGKPFLLLAGVQKLLGTVGLLGALREVRNVEMVSYLLILAIGIWRLWAGITGRLHEHHHGDDHGHGHDHDHHHHAHDHLCDYL